MEIKNLRRLLENVESVESPEEMMGNPDIREAILELRMETKRLALFGKELITEKRGEKDIKLIISMIRKAVLAEIFIDPTASASLVMAAIDGTLIPFTDTVICAVIGALVEEEIL